MQYCNIAIALTDWPKIVIRIDHHQTVRARHSLLTPPPVAATSLKPSLPTRLATRLPPPPPTTMAPRSSPVQMLWPGAQPSTSCPCWCGRLRLPVVHVLGAAGVVPRDCRGTAGAVRGVHVRRVPRVDACAESVSGARAAGWRDRAPAHHAGQVVAPSTTKDKLPSLDAKTISSPCCGAGTSHARSRRAGRASSTSSCATSSSRGGTTSSSARTTTSPRPRPS